MDTGRRKREEGGENQEVEIDKNLSRSTKKIDMLQERLNSNLLRIKRGIIANKNISDGFIKSNKYHIHLHFNHNFNALLYSKLST